MYSLGGESVNKKLSKVSAGFKTLWFYSLGFKYVYFLFK